MKYIIQKVKNYIKSRKLYKIKIYSIINIKSII